MCENMTKRIYEIGKPLGLNKRDISEILNRSSSVIEQSSLGAGPTIYPGDFYGTISIYDFF